MADDTNMRNRMTDDCSPEQANPKVLPEASEPADQPWPELKMSEQKFMDIFMNSLDVLLIIDVDTGKILAANRAMERILGYELSAAVGRHFSILHPPEKGSPTDEGPDAFSVHGAVFHAQRMLRSDGTLVPMDLTATPIPWEGKSAVLATYRDVSDRENALQALRESEKRYRTLFDQAVDAIILENETGRIVDVNRAACLLTGYSDKELLAMKAADLWPQDDRRFSIYAREDRALDAPFESIAQCNEGGTRPVEITIAPLVAGERKSVFYIVRDITERKRAEEELLQAHAQLERRVHERTIELERLNERLLVEIAERKRAEEQIKASLAEKEVLLQEIHHRVKNNLQIVSSLLALQGRKIEDEKVAAALNDSQIRIRSMALIHEQLYESRDLARIDFAAYLDKLSGALLRSYAAEAGSVTLKIESDPVLLGIETAIPCGLIVSELVSNCLKHAFPRGRRGEIRIELRCSGENQYTLVVSDNGQGFPKGLDYRKSKSLGLRLITNLAESQLRADLEIRGDHGTEVRIVFEDKQLPAKQR
ncbi:MAG: PAS domain S-box protein [Desulfomonile tiedjei]|nr:PAS domain S-box protein [Desulfomonile tiedjei]